MSPLECENADATCWVDEMTKCVRGLSRRPGYTLIDGFPQGLFAWIIKLVKPEFIRGIGKPKVGIWIGKSKRSPGSGSAKRFA